MPIKHLGKESLAGCCRLEGCVVPGGVGIEDRALEDTCFLQEREDGLCVAGDMVVSGDRCEGVVKLPKGVSL